MLLIYEQAPVGGGDNLRVNFGGRRMRASSNAGSAVLSDAGSAISNTSKASKSKRPTNSDLPFSQQEHRKWRTHVIPLWFMAIANEKVCREWKEGWRNALLDEILLTHWPEKKLIGTQHEAAIRSRVSTILL